MEPMTSKLVASAPARADFLNTHQDYKGLPVVPVALDLRIYLTAKPADGNIITVKSEDLESLHERSADSFQVKHNDLLGKGFFGNYFRGALNVIVEQGATDRIRGLDITVSSDIPIGSGLASSAALTVAFVALLNERFDLGFDRRGLAEIAYVAESQRVGTRCGRLDQYGVTFGGVIKLDCKPPYTVEELPFTNLTFAVADSGVRHSTQDVHTERQTEINRGLKALMEHKAIPRELKNKLGYTYDQPKWLEVSEQDIEDFLSVLDEEAKRRILFTIKMIGLTDVALKILRNERVSEEEVVSNFGKETWSRVQEATPDEADYVLLGHSMNEQQALLRELYNVSLPKIEDMCTAAMAAGAYGVKISGAGMGGSIIALVKDKETGKRVVNACRSVGAENGWVSRVAEGVRVGSQAGSS
jgi:galactokinase